MTKFSRICLTLLTLSFIFQLSACATAWTSEATNIINELVPAIQAILAILAIAGVGITPDVLAAVNKWATEATNALTNVITPLINEYNSAAAAAQPGILNQIEAAVKTITDDLGPILATIHVTNPKTQAEVLAVIEAVQAELIALLNLVPVIKAGSTLSHEEVVKLMSSVKSAKSFKQDFNSKAKVFGPQFTLK